MGMGIIVLCSFSFFLSFILSSCVLMGNKFFILSSTHQSLASPQHCKLRKQTAVQTGDEFGCWLVFQLSCSYCIEVGIHKCLGGGYPSNCWFQLVRTGSELGLILTAPVGRSVHRMGCVFHPCLHPTLTNILPQSIFLLADLWSFFLFFGPIFSQPWPPYYPPT